MRYRITAEELEVDKLNEAKQQAKVSNEFDVLYHLAKQKNEEGTETEEATYDGSDPVDVESEDTNEDEEPTGEPTIEPAIEYFKDIQYDDIALEDFISTVTPAVKYVAQHAMVLAKFGVSVTGLGLTKAFKGVVFLMTRIISLTIDSIGLIDKHSTRFLHSFSNLKADIASIKKSLNEVEDADLAELKFTNERTINTLKIADSVDFSNNIEQLSSFMDATMKQMMSQVDKDLSAIKYLIAYATNGSTKVPSRLMTDSLFADVMTQSAVEGYDYDKELLTAYVSKELLPGDIRLMLQSAKPELESLEDINKAYNQSTMFLGLDTKEFKNINSVDYLSKADLVTFLDKLDALCDTCISHKLLYETVAKKKGAIRHNFRAYFMSILHAKSKVSLKDSLLQYCYLKTVFTDKVYLSAAIDIHDYSIKVLTNGVAYARDNATKLIQ